MKKLFAGAAMGVLGACAAAPAQVALETVTIRHPGNSGELSGDTVTTVGSGHGFGETRVCGRVDYIYEIGTYEVTERQYVTFLNAVAADDTYGLYNTQMNGTTYNCAITRSGAPGGYTYSVPADWADRPIVYIAWADAARFANWMHNGQPTGPQNAGTTEDGSYTLNGATTNPQLNMIFRNPGATWVLPTEDEWYKAAYHKNNGPTGNYWDFPMQSDMVFDANQWPRNDVLTPDPGNSACFWIAINDQCIGPPYFRTAVGEFENSASPYGTFDQGGNAWEWTESRPTSNGTMLQKRVLRGGSYYNTESFDQMHAAYRNSDFTAAQLGRYGFRLVRLISGDCNGNGVPDQQDLAAGTSHDRNFNDVPDECDIASGRSQDCNHNGIPDEVEVGRVAPAEYTLDDGHADDSFGLAGGTLAWLNQFSVMPDRGTIAAVSLSYGLGLVDIDGLPITVYLWSDPNGDGDPGDAVVLASAQTVVANSNTDIMNVTPIPPTFVGPPGTSFFVGAILTLPGQAFPAHMDYSSALSDTINRSWIYADADTINPNALGAAGFGGMLWTQGIPATLIVRAVAARAALNDSNGDGVPDDCGCGSSDFNCDGDVGTDADIESFFACLAGGCPAPPCGSTADFNGDGDVGTDADIEAFFRVLAGGTC